MASICADLSPRPPLLGTLADSFCRSQGTPPFLITESLRLPILLKLSPSCISLVIYLTFPCFRSCLEIWSLFKKIDRLLGACLLAHSVHSTSIALSPFLALSRLSPDVIKRKIVFKLCVPLSKCFPFFFSRVIFEILR